LSLHQSGLSVLKAIQHQLHSSRNAQFVENLEQIISHDLLRTRGWLPQRIAFAFYGVTLALVAIGWLGVRTQSREFWAVSFVSLGLMTFAAVRLGALRGGEREKPVLQKRGRITEGECGETSQTG
jgi:hypothetical protein